MTRYVVLDTETTGTSPERDRVVWVAASIVEDRNVTQRWSTFLDPGPTAGCELPASTWPDSPSSPTSRCG